MKVALRRGRWVADAYIHGRRVVKAYATKREAEEAVSKLKLERRQRTNPAVDPFITLAEYKARFLDDCREQEAVDATVQRYARALDNHILPALGETRLRDLTRSDIRTFLLGRRQEGTSLQGQKGEDRIPKGALSKASVRQILSVLSCVLSLAVDDEIISTNPALGAMRTRRTKEQRRKARGRVVESVKAMTTDQRNLFLAVAEQRASEAYPAFMLMALCGLRLGEVLGLKWASVDVEGRKIRVHEQITSATTKTGGERTVDMAAPLAAMLRSLLARRRQEAFRSGGEMSPYVVFPWLSAKPDAQEEQKAAKRIRREMSRALAEAGLPGHFVPHSLRHTFCSLLIASGVSPVYVQQQAGHASVQMTVSVYGSWFPVAAPGAMDRLAAGVPVTKPPSTGNSVSGVSPQVVQGTGTYGAPTVNRPFPG